jgi:hypothetical protein
MDANSRYFPETQAFGGLNPTMAREDTPRSVNHDRPEEPKILDTLRKLTKLPIAVYPRIPGIEFQICDGNSNDGGRQAWIWPRQSAGCFGCLQWVFRLVCHRTIL